MSVYILTFYSTHTALKAEGILKDEGMDFKLIPTPGGLVSGCGLSISFYEAERSAIINTLNKKGIKKFSCYIKTETGYTLLNR